MNSLRDLPAIARAWFDFLTTAPSKEDKRRAHICKACPFAKHSDFLELVGGKVTEVKGLYCNLCKCPLVAKIKTNDKNQICEKWL